jgi:hypothetical protein
MKDFNTTGTCIPSIHYMVYPLDRLMNIKALVDKNKYIIINRPRQFGKTTTLALLQDILAPDYAVLKLSIEGVEEGRFSEAFCATVTAEIEDLLQYGKTGLSDEAKTAFLSCIAKKNNKPELLDLTKAFEACCRASEKRVVLIIDEIDHGCDEWILFSFLAALRNDYLNIKDRAFYSVILCGVSDIRNLRAKVQPDAESSGVSKTPWNIAVSYTDDMSFSQKEIATMISEYMADCKLSFDVGLMSGLISEFTSGYPILVSTICSIIHKNATGSMGFHDAWSRKGFMLALHELIHDDTVMIFQALKSQLEYSKELVTLLRRIVFFADRMDYRLGSPFEQAKLHGFVKVEKDNTLSISNRIFESWLFTHLDIEEASFARFASNYKWSTEQALNMELILERFSEQCNLVRTGEDNRKLISLFLSFLKPIINRSAFCHIESQTKDGKTLDIVIDNLERQEIMELKICLDERYRMEGLEQLAEFLDKFGCDHGYILVFSNPALNQVKCRSEVIYGGKKIVIYVVLSNHSLK